MDAPNENDLGESDSGSNSDGAPDQGRGKAELSADDARAGDFEESGVVSLDPDQPFWNRFYMVAPLIVVGTKDDNGTYDLAPKHMASPMGWRDYYGFVCTPRHKTYRNAKRTGTFTVSFPRPEQVILASLAAAPRTESPEAADGPGTKPSLEQLPTLPAQVVDGVFLEDAYLFLECEVHTVVDDLGENSLLIGRVVAVHAHRDALRLSEQDDQEAIRDNPLLAYLPPDRYATIDQANAFPFPAGFQK
jgi:flavin reductase (DIM6/NTAB) family NADH-FMN oxidoreductase RutF